LSVQTLHGIVQGGLLCSLADCDVRLSVASAILGAGVVGGGLWALTEVAFDGVRSGQAAAINAGTYWGLWNGVAGTFVIGEDDPRALVSGLMLAGTGLGALAAHLWAPDAGQVSMASSVGIWLGAVAGWTMVAAGSQGSAREFFAVELAVSNLGLVGGAVLSRYVKMSRGRTLLIDTGGILGMLLGVGTAFLINDSADAPLGGGLAIVGTLGGLTAGYFLTSDVGGPDPDDAGEQTMITPIGPLGSPGFSVATRF
jgi:hypothetical protein